MSEEKNVLKNNLLRYRLLFGYSQREIAYMLGLNSTSVIGRWEQGLAAPDLENAMRLSVIYKTLTEELYFDLRKSIINEFTIKDKKDLRDTNPP